jgi:hypothetical protein
MAVRVTAVPIPYASVQSPVPPVPQFIPDAVTLPFTGVGDIVSVNVCCVNVTDTVLAASMVRLHIEAAPNTAQSPPQLPTPKPPLGVAVRVTVAPLMKLSSQSPGQLIWWMVVLLVTVPFTGVGDTISGTVPWIKFESVNSVGDVPSVLTMPMFSARYRVLVVIWFGWPPPGIIVVVPTRRITSKIPAITETGSGTSSTVKFAVYDQLNVPSP